MTWNTGGFGQIPFGGMAAGSWNAGGYGLTPFDASPLPIEPPVPEPVAPIAIGGGSVITPPWHWVPFTPVHPRRARRRRHEEIVLL